MHRSAWLDGPNKTLYLLFSFLLTKKMLDIVKKVCLEEQKWSFVLQINQKMSGIEQE